LIRDAFAERFDGLALAYAVEDRPLGTGGAIRLAARSCTDEHVFVLNGDTFVEVDFAAMRAQHRQAAAVLTVCAVEIDDAFRYGRMRVENGRVSGFAEKGAAGPGLINAGVYLMRRDLLETLALPEVFSLEHDVLSARLGELRPAAFVTHGRFIDIGVPEDYARAQRMFSPAGD
jgi:D-glycero-alpha-D-manno-heptose 1-phosphate guanylyltransferase